MRAEEGSQGHEERAVCSTVMNQQLLYRRLSLLTE